MRSDLRVELPDGTLVGYAEAGDPAGPPVMYLHGSPSSRLEVGFPGIREAAENLGIRVLAPDRPGIGLSTFRRYTVADYPRLVRSFADALGLGRFAVIGVSGGGKYACACAWGLPDRVTRVALVSSTCSFDLPGARATWSADDRRLYRLADWTPWLVHLFFAKVARDVRRDPDVLFPAVERTVGAADKEVLAAQGFREALDRDTGEAFRQGGRGPAHDLTLEARPWGVPFERIQVPIEIWHGEEDRVVSPEQSRILARTLPLVTDHFVPGEGHFSLVARHARAIMQSVVGAPTVLGFPPALPHPYTDQEHTVSEPSKKSPSLPPRRFIRLFWVVQRAVYSVTGRRFGLRTARADRWGMLRLRTVGRRSGEERTAILGYFEDGPDLVTMAMNGWADPEPAWWLNLQAHPDVTVDLPGGSRPVHARAADPDERPRLWARWAAFNKDEDLDGYAARRSGETAVRRGALAQSVGT